MTDYKLTEKELQYLFAAVQTAEAFKPNYHKLAEQSGVSTANDAQKKFKKIVEKAGFKLVKGEILNGDGSTITGAEGPASPATPTPGAKGGKAKGGAKKNGAGASGKKRKASASADAESDTEDGDADGAVKTKAKQMDKGMGKNLGGRNLKKTKSDGAAEAPKVEAAEAEEENGEDDDDDQGEEA